MTTLLVCESRQGRLLGTTDELRGFALRLGGDAVMLVIGSTDVPPAFGGTVYVADAPSEKYYRPEAHTRIVLEAAAHARAQTIVFPHSTYGWDIAPRVAARLHAALITGVVAVSNGRYEVPCFNAKMRRSISPATSSAVITLQAGAFSLPPAFPGTAKCLHFDGTVDGETDARVEFLGYDDAPVKTLDLAKAEVIVSAGRGIGKKENVSLIAALAAAFGGELGATRPIVDAGWVDHDRQVGSTGQMVSPKLYIACGVSGAIQHLSGMKKSGFIVAINKDKDAPITSVANVLVHGDVMEVVPALTAAVQHSHHS